MISHILLAGDCDPTILVGGMLPAIGGNLRIGHSENFVNESCEYTNSFLSFFPTTAVILNVAEDHLDFFKDIDDIRSSFKRFAQLVPEDGYVILNSDIDDISYFTKDLKSHVITFGSNPAASDYSAADITYNERGCCHYTLLKDGAAVTDIELAVPGLHNVYNSLAAVIVGLNMKLSLDVIKKGLLSYTGTDRRFQKKGTMNGVTIIDDYAHHPDEIRATLTTAQNYPHKELWVVFQPHTYSRTKALFHKFADALSLADHVVLADIYAARETDTLGVSSQMLAETMKENGTDAYYLPDFPSIEEFLKEHCLHGDLLITMGAGNVVTIGEDLLKA
jgi:UDP-N-acetylmuramate--alanine ligase